MSGTSAQPPPHPPPLPPNRAGLLQRITAPFTLGTKIHGAHPARPNSTSPGNATASILSKRLPSQTTAHRTGIPILAIDLNRDKTHAILAGQEILKTIRIHEGKAIEEFNLRSAISSSPTYGPGSDPLNQRREFLPAKDVRWSHGVRYDTIIATAALNGRIALYDVSGSGGSRVELEWIHQHTGQVNKLDFDPFEGYLLLSGSQDKTVKIWDLRDPRAVLKRHNFYVRHPVRDVRWSPTAVGEFAVCTENGVIQKWDVRNPSQAVLSINAHEKSCYTIDWHPDGRHLASGGFDKHVRVWDLKSENRRQKPAFQLRTPQAVMNLRWRPAGWSSEWSHSGQWQCTQLATSYTEDDPRVHVWDLRRPLLPFRELDQYNSQPTDLVWASKDYLWTVGNEGMFTQTDIRYAPQGHDALSPCTSQFTPEGGLMTFSEDMRMGKTSAFDDPSAAFLRVRPRTLGEAMHDTASHWISDDDLEDELSISSVHRHISKAASTRSTKSQNNTPPNLDNFPTVISLDRSIHGQKDVFNNEQVGTLSQLDGITTELYVVDFLAINYARPSTIDDRQQEPHKILERLENAFTRNAEACDYVSYYRMAQSWRILCAVVIPELYEWAKQNCYNRLVSDASKNVPRNATIHHKTSLQTPESRPLQNINDSGKPHRPEKVVTNLFKGVLSVEKVRHDGESNSNMTTPLAVPLPDSPSSKSGDITGERWNEVIEAIPPLPPSVVASHSTAAAASKALISAGSDTSTSPQTTPEKQRQEPTSVISSPMVSTEKQAPTEIQAATLRKQAPQAFELTASPRSLRTQEDRRAAIRDYRAQARPLFTLETPAQASKDGKHMAYDSADSFPMFSASTESSHKLQSVNDSFDSAMPGEITREDSTEWQHVYNRDSLDSTPPSGEIGQKVAGRFPYSDYNSRKGSNDLALDEAPGFSFGADGEIAVKPSIKQTKSASASIWEIGDLEPPSRRADPQTTASSASDGMFHFEQVPAEPKIKIYASNPIRRLTSKQETVTLKSLQEQNLILSDDDLPAQGFVYSDLKPIDFTQYEPKLPWAWSAFPLICHMIAFDVNEGPACAQFAVHLLLHLHPFFFNQAFRRPLATDLPVPEALAERLMRPDLSSRIIEGLFLSHLQYLQKTHLYQPMAELKKMCVEFDYPAVFKAGLPDQPLGAAPTQDLHSLQILCRTCDASISGAGTCTQCSKPRGICPICLNAENLDSNLARQQRGLFGLSTIWTFCHVCGHGAHISCMQDWLQFPGAEGECPSVGCGCDCGPGVRRDQRRLRQATEAFNDEIIRGSRTGSPVTKKDPLRATPSPAVDKTRDTLRYADLRDHNAHTGSEVGRRNSSGRNGRNANAGGAGPHTRDNFGSKRVRLVTPREQDRSANQSSS